MALYESILINNTVLADLVAFIFGLFYTVCTLLRPPPPSPLRRRKTVVTCVKGTPLTRFLVFGSAPLSTSEKHFTILHLASNFQYRRTVRFIISSVRVSSIGIFKKKNYAEVQQIVFYHCQINPRSQL